MPRIVIPALCVLAILTGCFNTGDSNRISLWGIRAPEGGGEYEYLPDAAYITLYRAEHPNGAAVVICPGGGFGMRVSGPEGHKIAEWLNQHGITGIVLDYRLPKGRPEVPLLDARQAIRLTRAHAGEWGIDPARIGILGFSAGGNVAATVATLPVPGDASAKDPELQQLSHPDFGALVYPVISMQDGLTHPGSRSSLLGPEPTQAMLDRFSAERNVSAQTPPMYLAHAVDDALVPIESSRLFVAAMREAGRPVKLLETPDGGHGFDDYTGPSWFAWKKDFLAWLVEIGVIPAQDQ